MGFNDTMASYLTLALSHLLASRAIIEDTNKRNLLNNEFRRLTEGKTIQSIFHQAALRYTTDAWLKTQQIGYIKF